MGGEDGADGDALLLAAGEFVQGAVAQVGEAEQVQGLLDAFAHGGGRDRQLLHGVGEFLLDGVGDETVRGSWPTTPTTSASSRGGWCAVSRPSTVTRP